MAAELDFADVLDVARINFYGMFSTEKQFVEARRSCMGNELPCALASDIVLTLCSGPEARYQWECYPQVVDFLEANSLKHPCCTQMPSTDGKRMTWSEDARQSNAWDIADFVEC